MPSSGNDQYSAPAGDELEVSIFGPGYGECIVVHLGAGDWLCVDSCIDPYSGRPITLAYFAAMGLNPKVVLRLVVASHWDDDHVGGLADVFRSAITAKFVCSPTFQSNELQTILATWRKCNFLPFGSGVDEFDKVIGELRERSLNTANPRPVLAGQNKVVWERRDGHIAEVRTLSPSDAGYLAAVARLSQIAKEAPGLRRRLPAIYDNHASVVLSIRVGGVKILLGGDLQVRADRGHGWYAILDGHVGLKHEAYKIPHHGSHNGDDPEIWEKLLVPAPPVGTTPFVRANMRLPTTLDCQRILARTPNAYLTAPPLAGKFRLTNRNIEKKVRERTRQIQIVPGSFGHIRMRRRISGDSAWNIRLFGDALHMSDAETRLQAAVKS